MPRNRTARRQAAPDAPAGIRLVAFDLDGTLTRGRTCMEAIAAEFGFADQMAAWEQAHTDQELITARLGMWEHIKHHSCQDITDAIAGIPLAPGAADGIAALREAGIRTVIVSLTLAQCVAYFARRIGADAHIGTEPDGKGGFRHVFPATKPALLARHARALGIPPRELAAAGDSLGDVPMLRAARTSIYVGVALPDGFTPTWHLPRAPIDEIARIILAPDLRCEALLAISAGEPGRDGALVPIGHVQAGYLRAGEQPGSLVLVADHHRDRTEHVAAVSDDQDVSARAYVVLPAVKQWTGGDMPAGLFGDLSRNAAGRFLVELEFPAGQLPLVPLIFQQQDFPVLNGDPLDRHRERVSCSVRPKRRMRSHPPAPPGPAAPARP